MSEIVSSDSSNWKMKAVEEIVEFLDGKRIPLKQEDRDSMSGDIPYYGASGIIDYINDYIFDDELVLLGEDGENVISRNLPLAFKIKGKSWVNNHAHVLKPRQGFDIDFLTFRFEFQDYRSLISGSAQPKITQGKLAKLEFGLPSLNVQQKIAKILTTIDQLIEKTQAIIDKHTAIKQGMMTELFTRGIDPTTGQLRPPVEQAPHLYKETELGWVPKEWVYVALNQLVARLESGVSVNSDETSDYLSNRQILKTSCLSGCVFNPSEAKQIIQEDLERVDLSVKADSILISRMNTPALVGENAYISTDYPALFVPDRIWQTVPNETIKYSVKWLSYVLSSQKAREIISGLATGTSGSMKNISKPSFLSLKLGLPSFDEQQKQLSILEKEESFVDYNKILLDKYISVKAGLMQDLLTGKVSIVTEDIC